MAPRILGKVNKLSLLMVILWLGVFITFFCSGIALGVTVNPGILFIFSVLGLSLSTAAVDKYKAARKQTASSSQGKSAAARPTTSGPRLCVPLMESHAPVYEEETFTIYPLLVSPGTNAAIWSRKTPSVHSCEQRVWPSTYFGTQLVSGCLQRSMTSADAHRTSSEGVVCAGTRDDLVQRPLSCCEDWNFRPSYDRFLREESFEPTAGFSADNAISHTSRSEKELQRNEKVRDNILPETKTVTFDVGDSSEDKAVKKQTMESVHSGSAARGREDAPTQATRNAKEDNAQNTEFRNGDNSDVSTGSEGSLGGDFGELQRTRPSVSPKHTGKVAEVRPLKGNQFRFDPSDDDQITRMQLDKKTSSTALSIPTSPLAHGADPRISASELRKQSSKDAGRETEGRRSAFFQSSDWLEQDCRNAVANRAPGVIGRASRTSVPTARVRLESVQPSLLATGRVRLAVGDSPSLDNANVSEGSSTEMTTPKQVLSESVQATPKTSNKSVQHVERQADAGVSKSPKKKRTTGRLPMFLRPCKRKQGLTSYYREPRNK